MEEKNTIKGIEVIAYKGMNSDMSCRDFYYEIGKTYKTDKAELCHCGFHACLNPRDVLYFYSQDERSRYFKVKLSGEIAKCDEPYTKVAATEITILEEITDTFDDVIKTTEWWKNDNVLDLLYWSDGLAKVQRTNGEYNFINKYGKIISDEWFNWAGMFCEGFAGVRTTNGEYNFIDKDGKFLSEQWFNWADDFYDGVTRVLRGYGKFIKIDKTGKFIKNCSRIWEKLLKICNRIWKKQLKALR